MNMRKFLGDLWRIVGGRFGQAAPLAGLAGNADAVAFGSGRDTYGTVNSVWRGLNGRSLEIAEVQEEVAAETRGQVLLIGADDEANRRLLARLRSQPAIPPSGPVYREGFFSLVTLPTEQPAAWPGLEGEAWPASGEIMGLVSEADVLVYVYTRAQGWRAGDARWYARLRATGAPLVLVEGELSESHLDMAEAPSDATSGGAARQRATLPAGERPVAVCLAADSGVCETPADVVTLVDRILAQRQRLAIPLAQEIPGCRPMITGRAIRSGMLMAALLGAEPIPLLDLPLQVALYWKLALQVAAIHGHPGLDYRSREMLGTVAWNLGLRYLIQQALKLAPVLGWAASAGLSGLGAWVFGNALWRYYRDDGRWPAAAERLQTVQCGLRRQAAGWRAALRRGAARVSSRTWVHSVQARAARFTPGSIQLLQDEAVEIPGDAHGD